MIKATSLIKHTDTYSNPLLKKKKKKIATHVLKLKPQF